VRHGAAVMRLAQVLFSQGFGSRRECQGLIATGRVSIEGRTCLDPHEDFATAALTFHVNGAAWPYREHALIVLHKPAGYECSHKPRHHPSVYSLLPAPLRQRDVQAIGRLDEDTTGLLLLTDDGALIHRLTSPKRHVAKVYDVTCKHAVGESQTRQLRDGVTLRDEREDDHPQALRAGRPAARAAESGRPGDGGSQVRAAACEITGAATLRLTLLEGKYHQVKRMIAAVGNRVEALHRSQFGALTLPLDLPSGAWRWLDGPQAIVPESAADNAAHASLSRHPPP
jgi:16S rRNA pseudouridine516 synthase